MMDYASIIVAIITAAGGYLVARWRMESDKASAIKALTETIVMQSQQIQVLSRQINDLQKEVQRLTLENTKLAKKVEELKNG